MLSKLIATYSKCSRDKRASLFWRRLEPTELDNILDLGSEDGSHIARIIPFRRNVCIADVADAPLATGKKKFGFKTMLLTKNSKIPAPDKFFDIVFCSSVIEHVTVEESGLLPYRSGSEFRRAARECQHRFAEEIRRVGKRYFVQTPNKYFLIESHTWLPVIFVLLPRSLQTSIVGFLNKWWPKKTAPTWNLLTKREMQELFPDAEIVVERSLGMTKSIIAIKS